MRNLHSLVERCEESCTHRERERDWKTETELWRLMKWVQMIACCHLDTDPDGIIIQPMTVAWTHTHTFESCYVVYDKYTHRRQKDGYYLSLSQSTVIPCVYLDNKLQDSTNDHKSWRKKTGIHSSTWHVWSRLNPYLN